MVFNIASLQASAAMLAAVAVAIPAPMPQATTTDAASRFSAQSSMVSSIMSSASSLGPLPTSFSSDSAVPYSAVSRGSALPLRSDNVTGVTSHGPYSGTATTTGAPSNPVVGTTIVPMPPNPTETYYNRNGSLLNPQPLPYTPNGGLGTNGSLPRYMVNSDFDFESIALGLYQEWIELDLFNNGLAVFSDDDFTAAGLTAEDRAYIAYMAGQESRHAELLSNMLGEAAPPQCTYDYPFTTVREFVDFCQRLTRWGESGVWGFINHLDSRETAQLLAQSIATEARQQMSFRQMSGLFPMPVSFETGYPQSWAWTYLAPYISSCPANTTRLVWQNFPVLHIVNNANINRWSPNDTANYEVTGRRIADPSNSTLPTSESCMNLNTTGYGCGPAISRNRTEPLSFAGKQIFFEWENPGQAVGPNNSYLTSTMAGDPKYVMWANQLNVTYSDLTVTGNNTGYTFQPDAYVYQSNELINGTMAIALTDTNAPFSPFNLSMINPHVRALGLYAAG